MSKEIQKLKCLSKTISEMLKECMQALKDCGYCQRVMLILEEKQIPYTVRLIDPRHKPEWLMEVHPSSHLPVIQDGDTLVTESGNIQDFIEDKYPHPALPLDEEGGTRHHS